MATKKKAPVKTKEAKEETLFRQLVTAMVEARNRDEALKLSKQSKADCVDAVMELFGDSVLGMIDGAVVCVTDGEADVDDEDGDDEDGDD